MKVGEFGCHCSGIVAYQLKSLFLDRMAKKFNFTDGGKTMRNMLKTPVLSIMSTHLMDEGNVRVGSGTVFSGLMNGGNGRCHRITFQGYSDEIAETQWVHQGEIISLGRAPGDRVLVRLFKNEDGKMCLQVLGYS